MGRYCRKLPSSVVLLQNKPDVGGVNSGLKRRVDRQRLDRLLDSRDSALISCFFFAHEVHDFYRILIHHMLGVQNARSSDHA